MKLSQETKGGINAVGFVFAMAAGLAVVSVGVKAAVDVGCDIGAKVYSSFQDKVYPSHAPRH